jgi:DNA-binding response OmpR family regulator
MTKQSGRSASITSIVLADNDMLLREAVGDFLRQSGYVVHVAQDGLEALDLCRREKPDCVILDIIMPKLDGSRVCLLLRQDPELRNIFVVAFSSLSPRDYRAFPGMSADAYVAKGPLPITYQHLLAAIRQCQAKDASSYTEGIIGFEQVKPAQVVQEMLGELRHHANILRSLGTGVLELDLQGRILYADAGACEHLGEKEANLIGERLLVFVAPREGEALESLLSEFGRTTKPQRCRTTIRLRDRDLWVQICAVLDGDTCTSILILLHGDEGTDQPAE